MIIDRHAEWLGIAKPKSRKFDILPVQKPKPEPKPEPVHSEDNRPTLFCSYCKKPFKAGRSAFYAVKKEIKFCSKACRIDFKKHLAECKRCGKSFFKTISRKIYCGRRCAVAMAMKTYRSKPEVQERRRGFIQGFMGEKKEQKEPYNKLCYENLTIF